jgi:hypothetical protein
LPVAVEEEIVELVIEVVVVGDVALGPRSDLLLQEAQQRPRPPTMGVDSSAAMLRPIRSNSS